MLNETSIPLGRYQHFKGQEYSVLGLARHSETSEEFVVYRQEYGDHGLWVRPTQMFFEKVMVEGAEVPRFRHMGAEQLGRNDKPDTHFPDLPDDLPDELVQTILQAADLRIERIVSFGHASPGGFWYDQDQHEWVLILKGAATLRFEEELIEMKPGDFVNIPAHKRHRIEWTTPDEPTIWLAVHYGSEDVPD